VPIKDAIKTCKCKFCGKEFTMFQDERGELIFFPENTTRPAWGYLELMDHVRTQHREGYSMMTFAIALLKEQIIGCFEVT